MREGKAQRKTKETTVDVTLRLDWAGEGDISTGIGFFDHMLQQMSRHGWMQLSLKAQGDLEVDLHHTVEDVGICLGKAFRKAIEGATGIRRFGYAQIPMDECLVAVTVDLSGRPFLVYRGPTLGEVKGGFSLGLMETFLRALTVHGAMTLHVHVIESGDPHHLMEATFKALGRALGEATALDSRTQGVPSTKGLID